MHAAMALPEPGSGMRGDRISAPTWVLLDLDLGQVLDDLRRRPRPLVVTYGLGDRIVPVAAAVRPLGGRVLVMERNPIDRDRVRRQVIQAGLDAICRVHAWDVEIWATRHWTDRIAQWFGPAAVSHILLDEELGLLTLMQLEEVLPSLLPGDTLVARVRGGVGDADRPRRTPMTR